MAVSNYYSLSTLPSVSSQPRYPLTETVLLWVQNLIIIIRGSEVLFLPRIVQEGEIFLVGADDTASVTIVTNCIIQIVAPVNSFRPPAGFTKGAKSDDGAQ